MKEHEYEIIRVGDLVEVIDNHQTCLTKGLVKEIDAAPNPRGCPGPFLSVEGIHPIQISHTCTVYSSHFSVFRKIPPTPVMSYTGNIRLKNWMGFQILQVQDESGWRNTRTNEFSSTFKFMSNKFDSPIPYTDDELLVQKNLWAVANKAEQKFSEDALRKNTLKLIEKIRSDLKGAKPTNHFNDLLSYDVCRLPSFNLNSVKDAFPNLHIYINGNDTSSGDPSLDIGLKR